MGGDLPRVLSLDNYFLSENGTFQYEKDMEEAYRADMLKAFRKTLEEGRFPFIIVEDRHVLVAHFAQFWAHAKLAGYEVFIAETPGREDPESCFQRSSHGFSLEEVKEMARIWEDTPPHFLRLDTKSLFREDTLREEDIPEVDMEDADMAVGEDNEPIRFEADEELSSEGDLLESSTDDWGILVEDEDEVAQEVNHESGPCSWSPNLKPKVGILKRKAEENETGSETSETESEPEFVGEEVKKGENEGGILERSLGKRKHHSNALSSLALSYSRKERKKKKKLRWIDENKDSDDSKTFGFRIGRSQEAGLVIGPGAGYNQGTNPSMDVVGGLTFGKGGKLEVRDKSEENKKDRDKK